MITLELSGNIDLGEALRQATEDRIRGVARVVELTTEAVAVRWRGGVRRRTGRYADSIQSEMLSMAEGRVYTTVEYAPHEEYGTKQHEIRPRRAKVLRFEVGGRVRYAPSVQHPGTKGSLALTRAVQALAGPFVSRLSAALQEGT